MKDDSNTKRGAISKANAQMLVAVSVAAFVAVFCLFAAKAVWIADDAIVTVLS